MASMLLGAGISSIGSLIGAGKQASAIKSAAQTEAQAAEYAANLAAQGQQNALDFTKGVYQNAQSYAAPYQSAGTTALPYLLQAAAPGGAFNSTPTAAEVMALDPGYQFNLEQGQQALERAEAAAGGLVSGGALKAAAQYATNYTTNAYQNAYNQFLNTRQANYANLMGLAGLGENANALLTNAGTSAAYSNTNAALQGANLQGNYLTQGASAQAAGTVGVANAWNGALSNIGNLALQYPILNQLVQAQNRSGYDVGTNPADLWGPAGLLSGNSSEWLYGGQPPSYDYTNLANLG